MSRINRPKWSLVTSTPTASAPCAIRNTTTAATLREGWFCEEVGYVYENVVDARAALVRSPRIG
jgi:hypothetical protein